MYNTAKDGRKTDELIVAREEGNGYRKRGRKRVRGRTRVLPMRRRELTTRGTKPGREPTMRAFGSDAEEEGRGWSESRIRNEGKGCGAIYFEITILSFGVCTNSPFKGIVFGTPLFLYYFYLKNILFLNI